MSPLVKICGITTQSQAIECANLGADFIGLNFWPQSKRFLKLNSSSELLEWKRIVPQRTQVVGLFVNPPAGHDFFNREALDAIQLHGEESPEFCAQLQARGFRVIKAFQVRDASSLDRIADYDVKDVLLDAYTPTERGGSGHTFPWALAIRFKEMYPQRNLWLAGGLTPANVAEAAHGVLPYAVDVASGVEDSQPGIKSMSKVTDFIQAAKSPRNERLITK